MKRSVPLLCCALLIACLLTGCQKPAEMFSSTDLPTASDTDGRVCVAYNREDTLDPFAAQTQLNVLLVPLLYDSPVVLDGNWMPQSGMCTFEQTDDTHIALQLKAGLRFSDGSAVTLQDVAYSFRLAKQSAQYRTRLQNVKDITVKGKTATITLATADRYAAACLNFPVIKQNSTVSTANTAAVGSGPFVFDATAVTLTANQHAREGNRAVKDTVILRHLANGAAVLQALENGSIHYMYDDLSDGNIPRTSIKDTAVDLPQLVYIGMNGAKPLTANPTYRRAICAALDRSAVSAAAYAGRALPATSPFHPNWKPAYGVSVASANTDATAATLLKQALDASATATAATTAQTTVTTTSGTEAQALIFIYPEGNRCREAAVKMVVSQLGAIGITVTPTPLAYDTYQSRLQAGDYDLYLGEIRLTPDMDLSVFLQAGGAAAYGVSAGDLTAKYAAFRNGSENANAFATAFGELMPYIPLCWRQGMAVAAPSASHIVPSVYDVYDGL